MTRLPEQLPGWVGRLAEGVVLLLLGGFLGDRVGTSGVRDTVAGLTTQVEVLKNEQTNLRSAATENRQEILEAIAKLRDEMRDELSYRKRATDYMQKNGGGG